MDLVVTSALAHSVTAVFELVSVKLENWNFASMCVSVAAFRKHSIKVKGQVSRWGQGRKTAKKWQIWTLRINCIWQGRALFDTGDSDVHQHVLYQIKTPIDPVRCGISELWSENHMSDCQKLQLKKWKSAKRAFLGRYLTFWVNLIRRIRILQKFWLLDNV